MQTQSTMTFELGTINPADALLYTQQFITTSGYTDPERVDENHDTLIAMGLGLLEDCPPWSRGDHVLAIRARLGRRLTDQEMRQLARLYKVSRSRVANNATTASNWSQERRWATEHVGYSHHEVLNSLSPDEQDALIELADANAWSCDELAAHCYAGNSTQPVMPSVTVPDNGKPKSSIYAGIPDDEPAYTDNAMYASEFDMPWNSDARISIPREPLQAAVVLRAEFSEGEIATLIDAFLR